MVRARVDQADPAVATHRSRECGDSVEDPAPAAARAVAEAEERRRLAQQTPEPRPKELGGRRNGPEPTRYGDWEKNGIAVDF